MGKNGGKIRILVIDDDAVACEFLQEALLRAGYEVATFTSARNALQGDLEQYDLLLSDIRMPDIDGLQFLRMVHERRPQLPVILMTAFGSLETTMEALRFGASDYISKPFSPDAIRSLVRKVLDVRELQQLQTQGLSEVQEEPQFIGSSAVMVDFYKQIARVADASASVLISGESGTGKELTARSLHQFSARRDKPFVAVNCSAIPETLLESELFGFEKGAFTGADRQRIGRFELANDGTLFLDEVGNMSPSTQAKVLRAIQEQEFERVGGSRTLKVDVRLIAATNIDLTAAIRDGKFREDLYYRLNVVNLHVPPLRERREDIPPLARHFLLSLGREMKRPVKGFSDTALEMLMRHDWPGNVRELENTVERAVLMSDSDTISEKDLSILQRPAGGEFEPRPVVDRQLLNLEAMEKEAVLEALRRCNWVQKEAAKLLGVSSRVMNYKIHKFGITNDHWTRNRQN